MIEKKIVRLYVPFSIETHEKWNTYEFIKQLKGGLKNESFDCKIDLRCIEWRRKIMRNTWKMKRTEFYSRFYTV